MDDQQPIVESRCSASHLRVLAIGTDADLARPAGLALGDALQRQLKYAGLLADYQMIVRTLGGRPYRLRPGAGFGVVASGSRNRATFPFNAYRLGLGLHRQTPFDLVSTEDAMLCGLAGLLLKRRLGLPLSVQFAGDMLDNPYWLADRPLNPLLNALGKWLVLQADTARVVSTTERDKLMKLGLSADRIRNIGWMADFSRFQDVDGRGLRAELLPRPFERLVLFVGRLVKQKDLPTLLRAAALVRQKRPDARFVIVGGGDQEDLARRLAVELALGDGLVFTGPVPHQAVPGYYAACDVFALPSRYEGNARVLAEAGASGRPVVTADVSGARDTVLEGETGFVVPIGRPDLLAGRLLELLDDPDRGEAMGARGREHVLQLYGDARLLAGFRDLWIYTAAQRAR